MFFIAKMTKIDIPRFTRVKSTISTNLIYTFIKASSMYFLLVLSSVARSGIIFANQRLNDESTWITVARPAGEGRVRVERRRTMGWKRKSRGSEGWKSQRYETVVRVSVENGVGRGCGASVWRPRSSSNEVVGVDAAMCSSVDARSVISRCRALTEWTFGVYVLSKPRLLLRFIVIDDRTWRGTK